MLTKLPLLQKELFEYSAKKTIYILRIVYGVILYSLFLYYWHILTQKTDFETLGTGKKLLEDLCKLNLLTIILILSVSSSSIISNERQQNTLSLLLICKLSPFSIVLQKALALIIKPFSFIIISFPLIYLCYLLGGVTGKDVYFCIYSLFITTIEVVVIGIFWSCLSAKSTTALVGTYTTQLFLYGTIAINITREASVSIGQYIGPHLFFKHDSYATVLDYHVQTCFLWPIYLLVLFCASKYLSTTHRKNVKKEKKSNRLFTHFSVPRFCVIFLCIVAGSVLLYFVDIYLFEIYIHIFFEIIVGLFFLMLLTQKPSIRYPILWHEVSQQNYTKKILSLVLLLWGCGFTINLLSLRYFPYSNIYRVYYVDLVLFCPLIMMLLVVKHACKSFFNPYKKDPALLCVMSPNSIFWQKFFSITRLTGIFSFTATLIFFWYFIYEQSPNGLSLPMLIMTLYKIGLYCFIMFFISCFVVQCFAILMAILLQKKNTTQLTIAIVIAWVLLTTLLINHNEVFDIKWLSSFISPLFFIYEQIVELHNTVNSTRIDIRNFSTIISQVITAIVFCIIAYITFHIRCRKTQM